MLINLLITLLVAGIVMYIINMILASIPMAPAIKNIIYAIIGLAFLIWILRLLGFAF